MSAPRALVLGPESNVCIDHRNCVAGTKDWAEGINNLDKAMAFLVTTIFITGQILVWGATRHHLLNKIVAYYPNLVAHLKEIVMMYGKGRLMATPFICARAMVGTHEAATKLYGTSVNGVNEKGDALEGKDRALAVAHGVTSTSQEFINILRSGPCSITALAVGILGIQTGFTSTVLTGFAYLTLVKHAFNVVQYGIDQAGGKDKESGKEDKTNANNLAIGGVIGVCELTLALAKVCSVTLPLFPLLAIMGTVSSLQLWQRIKKTDEKLEKERFVKGDADARVADAQHKAQLALNLVPVLKRIRDNQLGLGELRDHAAFNEMIAE